MMGARAFIALGSNLQNPAAQVTQAFSALAGLPGTALRRRSSLYRTAPVGYDDQPDFINAVAEVSTVLEPLDLMRALLVLEADFGRERTFANAPRVLDLDLLLYDERVMQAPDLILPHPRMHERGFVLFPLVEIAPETQIPGRGLARELLDNCLDQGVEKLS